MVTDLYGYVVLVIVMSRRGRGRGVVGPWWVGAKECEYATGTESPWIRCEVRSAKRGMRERRRECSVDTAGRAGIRGRGDGIAP